MGLRYHSDERQARTRACVGKLPPNGRDGNSQRDGFLAGQEAELIERVHAAPVDHLSDLRVIDECNAAVVCELRFRKR
jgi:hypothetical protein